jgi:hypothetical protein
VARHLFVVLLWSGLIVSGHNWTYAQSDIPADTVITLERTICYGSCPMYKLTIKADGSVEFEPRYVKDRSIVSAEIKRGNITREQLMQLISEFERARYFSLNNRYMDERDGCPAVWTDSPSAITSIRINRKEKTIKHYYGCQERTTDMSLSQVFPRELTELESKIDEIVNTKQWLNQ